MWLLFTGSDWLCKENMRVHAIFKDLKKQDFSQASQLRGCDWHNKMWPSLMPLGTEPLAINIIWKAWLELGLYWPGYVLLADTQYSICIHYMLHYSQIMSVGGDTRKKQECVEHIGWNQIYFLATFVHLPAWGQHLGPAYYHHSSDTSFTWGHHLSGHKVAICEPQWVMLCFWPGPLSLYMDKAIVLWH